MLDTLLPELLRKLLRAAIQLQKAVRSHGIFLRISFDFCLHIDCALNEPYSQCTKVISEIKVTFMFF